MPDHLQIAQGFVKEQMARRSDIIAALVVGSVARGQADETSDIDIAIYVPDTKGEGPRDLSCWRQGVYLEAGVVTPDGLGSVEEVMHKPVNACHMREAVILYDPTGYFGTLQAQVRAVFMEPKWLRIRLDWVLEACRGSLAKLKQAVPADDDLSICEHAMTLSHRAASVPLYIHGLTPSSTRKLYQLRNACPEMRTKLIQYECALPDSRIDKNALLNVGRSCCEAAKRIDLGGLSEYMIRKAERTMQKGDLREAIDMLWTAIGVNVWMGKPDRGVLPHVREWLTRVGWSGTGAMTEKLRLAEDLQAEIEGMAATVSGADCA